MNSIGTLFRLTSFGESHGAGIGGIIDGMPSGIEGDMDFIQSELARRKPGQSHLTTARKEADEIVAGARAKAGNAVADLKAEKERIESEIGILKSTAKDYRSRFLRLVEDQTHVINSESELFKDD